MIDIFIILIFPFLLIYGQRLCFLFNKGLYIDLFIPKKYREVIWEAVKDEKNI